MFLLNVDLHLYVLIRNLKTVVVNVQVLKYLFDFCTLYLNLLAKYSFVIDLELMAEKYFQAYVCVGSHHHHSCSLLHYHHIMQNVVITSYLFLQAEAMVVEWKEYLWDVPEERAALWGHCQTLFLRYSFPPLQVLVLKLTHCWLQHFYLSMMSDGITRAGRILFPQTCRSH